MNINTQFLDKLAMSISGLCVAHCLIFPVLAVFIPSLVALGLTSEDFHFWMVISVIPSSILALALGCKKHSNLSVAILGALGLSALLLALTLGHDLLGEFGERGLTFTGAVLIALAHYKNFKLCREVDICKCSNSNKSQE